jgi:hypothetical protein
MGSNVLDHRERVVPGIDNAFEHGHAVSTSIFWFLVDTHSGPAVLAVRCRLQSQGVPKASLKPAGIN